MSIVQKKLNKLKEIVSSKKKKAFEATAGKFVSNGSLLSQNGLRNSEDQLQNKIGGELTASTASSQSVFVGHFVSLTGHREMCSTTKVDKS